MKPPVNPSKNCRAYLFGSTQAIVAPVGSDAAWEAILTVRRALFGKSVRTEPMAMIVAQGNVKRCRRCDAPVPDTKKSGYRRKLCDACWAEQQRSAALTVVPERGAA